MRSGDQIPGGGLHGRWVSLRPLLPEHHRLLFQAVTLSDGPSWPSRNPTPGFDGFVADLGASVLAQYLIVGRDSGVIAGAVQCSHANHRHGTAQISVFVVPDMRGRAWPLEGAGLFVDHLFRQFHLRKLYAEVSAPVLSQFSSGIGTFFNLEATLEERLWANNAWGPAHIISVSNPNNTWADVLGGLNPS